MNASTLRAAALAGLATLLIAVASAAGPSFSTAAFTMQTANVQNRVAAAADWTPPTVALQSAESPLRGQISITAVAADGESGVHDVVIAVQPVGSSTWTTQCTATAAPYTCAWDTRIVADGDYDVRAVATDNAGYTASSMLRTTVANHVGVVLASPAAVVGGSLTLATMLQNPGTAPFLVRVEYAVVGSGAWAALCDGLAAPYSCTWNTASMADAAYDLRSVAVLNGVSSVSAPVTGVLVDNTAPAVTMSDPGGTLTGTVALAAAASDAGSGISNVTLQVAAANTANWTNACVATTSPYSCSFATTAMANGAYIFRAVATDVAGNATTSASTAARNIDNGAPAARDVQTANGTGTAGRMDAGDTLTFTYSKQMNPASLSAGWEGSATPVVVRLQDGALLGRGSSGDTVDVQRAGLPVALGSILLNQDYIKDAKTSLQNGIMTAQTTTVNGAAVTVVTITVGSLISGGALNTVTAASAVVWTPSASATDLGGTPCSTTPVTETGASDQEF